MYPKVNRATIIKLLFLIAAVTVLGGFFLFKYSENERKKFKVVFLNVGQGDAALIQFENSEKMLVDCGPGRDILSALGRNMFFFERKIDYLLITHPDADHFGGCIDVLKSYEVKKIITNGRISKDPAYEALLLAIKEEGVSIESVEDPKTISIHNSELKFYSPDRGLAVDAKINDNDRSLVFKLINAKKNILFTGDMEEPVENALIKKYCQEDCTEFRSDILKVGHHGSDSSSGEKFLKIVKPNDAVISVGKNRFGHPSLRVVRRLQRVGTKILRTDQLGDVIYSYP